MLAKCCPFARLTSQHSTDNYLEILKLTGCYIYNLNWCISFFICCYFWPPSTYQECITLREQVFCLFSVEAEGYLFVLGLFFCCCFALLYFLLVSFQFAPEKWERGRWAVFRLQGFNMMGTVAFSDKDTVQRWMPGIIPLPAASQELQLLFLTHFVPGAGDFLLTAGPQQWLWSKHRPGWLCSTPI